MPPNDVKTGAAAYSPLGAATSRPSSWASSVTSRWLAEEEEKWRKRMAAGGAEAEEHWEEKRRRGSEPKNDMAKQYKDQQQMVRALDEQLARLREAPVTMVNGTGKFAVSIDMSIFRAEDIEVLMSVGQLVVSAEREVQLDDRISVVRRFRRKLAIPADVGTDAVAVHMSGRGILTITALRRARG